MSFCAPVILSIPAIIFGREIRKSASGAGVFERSLAGIGFYLGFATMSIGVAVWAFFIFGFIYICIKNLFS
jgi:hypothetical protein